MGKNAGMGVEFLDIDSEALAIIRAFVDTQLRQTSDTAPAPREATVVRRFTPATPLDTVVALPDGPMTQIVVGGLGFDFDVRLVNSGLRALSECIRQTPRLIVAGVELPGMGGLELLRIARERSTLSAVPFVIVGTRFDETARLAAFRAGADDVISWPVTDAELAGAHRPDSPARGHIGRPRRPQGPAGRDPPGQPGQSLQPPRDGSQSGYLLVVRDAETALLGFRNGQIVRADVRAEVQGKEKIFYLLDWTDGRFEFVSQDVGTGDEIETTTSHLLIEHAQLRDEAAAGRPDRGRLWARTVGFGCRRGGGFMG